MSGDSETRFNDILVKGVKDALTCAGFVLFNPQEIAVLRALITKYDNGASFTHELFVNGAAYFIGNQEIRRAVFLNKIGVRGSSSDADARAALAHTTLTPATATTAQQHPPAMLPGDVLYKHYKTGGLYRKLFDAGAWPGLSDASRKLFTAIVSTNNDALNGKRVMVYSMTAERIVTDLGVPSIVYVSLSDGEIYVRESNEFYGYVTDPTAPEPPRIRRFRDVGGFVR